MDNNMTNDITNMISKDRLSHIDRVVEAIERDKHGGMVTVPRVFLEEIGRTLFNTGKMDLCAQLNGYLAGWQHIRPEDTPDEFIAAIEAELSAELPGIKALATIDVTMKQGKEKMTEDDKPANDLERRIERIEQVVALHVSKLEVDDIDKALFAVKSPNAIPIETASRLTDWWSDEWAKRGVKPAPMLIILSEGFELECLTDAKLTHYGLKRI